jgi:hypothetical protein
MIDVQSSNNLLFSGGGLTLIILSITLAIFGSLALRYRNIRSFESQMSIFIIVYIVVEILEDYKIPFSILPYIGSQIHIVSAGFLVIILWLRLYTVRKTGRKMIDKLESGDDGGVDHANENI